MRSCLIALSGADIGSTRARPLARPLGRGMGDGERAMLVTLVLGVGAVERLQKGLLLVCVVLIGLRLGQVCDGVVRHGGVLSNRRLGKHASANSRRARVLGCTLI